MALEKKLMDKLVIKTPGLDDVEYYFTDGTSITDIILNEEKVQTRTDPETGRITAIIECASKEDLIEIEGKIASLNIKFNQLKEGKTDRFTELNSTSKSYVSNTAGDEGACLRIERLDEIGNLKEQAGISVNDNDKLTAQIYSVDKDKKGVRLDINSEGIFYTEGNESLDKRVVEDNKIATHKLVKQWAPEFKGNYNTLPDLNAATGVTIFPNESDYAVVEKYRLPTEQPEDITRWMFVWKKIQGVFQWHAEYRMGGSTPAELEAIKEAIKKLNAEKLTAFNDEDVYVHDDFKFEGFENNGVLSTTKHGLTNDPEKRAGQDFNLTITTATPNKKVNDVIDRSTQPEIYVEGGKGKAGLMSAEDKYIIDHAQLIVKVIYHDPKEEM